MGGMSRLWDCIVAGSCVADVICRPVPLDVPVGHEALRRTEPIVLSPGGITSNSGLALSCPVSYIHLTLPTIYSV